MLNAGKHHVPKTFLVKFKYALKGQLQSSLATTPGSGSSDPSAETCCMQYKTAAGSEAL